MCFAIPLRERALSPLFVDVLLAQQPKQKKKNQKVTTRKRRKFEEKKKQTSLFAHYFLRELDIPIQSFKGLGER